MTDETVDCYNCGRTNPEWAQVCRSCGVALQHDSAAAAPDGRFPTDQQSLISIGAVLGTILLAVVVGLFISGLNSTDPPVAQASPTPPSPSVTARVTPSPSVAPEPTVVPTPTPVPTPQLPGTLTFGQSLDAEGRIAEPVDTFTPAMTFGYSVTVPEPFGGPIENEIIRLSDEVPVLERQSVTVNPEATTFGYIIGPAADFIADWGTGEFEWRTYVGGELAARSTFRFSEG